MNLTKLPGWPALVAHELTHAAAAAPYADARIRLFTTHPHVELHWQRGTPRLAVRVAHLAPTIVGLLCTAVLAVVAAPAFAVALPSNPFNAAALGLLLAYNWWLYCWPSASDRRPFDSDAGGGA